MAYVNRKLDEDLAGTPKVMTELGNLAWNRAVVARAQAARHSKTGRFAASIDVVRHEKGWAVLFDDPNAAHKNYGHFDESGQWIEGVGAAEAAMGDVV